MDNDYLERLRELLFGVEDDVDKMDVYGRAVVLIGLTLWGGYFLTLPVASEDIYYSWLHYVHLVFHEAGHMLFMVFGDWMTSAGGTIMQLLMPAICLGTFLFKEHNRFGAAVCGWWFGHSLMDCGPYAADAKSQTMMLLGGVTGQDVPGYHDWNSMLRPLDLLDQAEAIGAALHVAGAATIVLSLLWGGYLVFVQFRHAKDRPF
jgi:hypothetical protein